MQCGGLPKGGRGSPSPLPSGGGWRSDVRPPTLKNKNLCYINMVNNKTKKNRYKKKQKGGINNMRIQNKSMFNRNNNSNKMIPYSNRNTMNPYSNPYSNRNTMIPYSSPYSNDNSKTNINLTHDKIANIIPDKNPNQKKQTLRDAYNTTIIPHQQQYSLVQRAYDNPGFFGKLGQVVKKGLLNAIENTGNYVGVNLQNPNEITNQLMAVKKTLENTTNLQEIAIIGSLVLEASMPFIEPLVDKVIFYGEEAGERIGKAIVSVILNTLEAIPIYGILVGTIRTFNTIVVTVLASINTAALTIQEIRNTVQFTMDEFEGLKREYMYQLQKQREKSVNRIQNSIQNFNGGAKI